MTKNTGIPYEQLTQVIFDNILNQSETKTIDVKQNIILQGKTTHHQIDVFWEFEQGGIKYQTIIQAKDWNQRVKQEQLFTFKSVLEDLPGQPRGVFVTKTGYQKGAKEVAEKNGILLFELREPNEKDLEGRIKTIILNFNALIPDSRIRNLEIDQNWTRKELAKKGFKGDFKFQMGAKTNEIFLFDESKMQKGTLYDLINTFYPKSNEELPITCINHDFTDDTYIRSTTKPLSFLKLKKIIVDIWVTKMELKSELHYDDIVGFILKNVIDGDIKVIKKDYTLMRDE